MNPNQGPAVGFHVALALRFRVDRVSKASEFGLLVQERTIFFHPVAPQGHNAVWKPSIQGTQPSRGSW